MSIWPTAEEDKAVKEKLGGYNSMPPNWVPITESEYYWRWSVGPAHRIYQYRQVVIEEGKPYCDTSMFVHPGDFSGIGFYVLYDGAATRSEIDAYAPRYFKWRVCEHDWETITNRMTYKEYRCRKCGYQEAIDSSG